jgi:hypothetical protein
MLAELTPHVDSEMLRFFHPSSVHRELPYQHHGHPTGSQHSFHDALPKLLLSTNHSQTLVNELSYVHHLYLLYLAYLDRSRLTEQQEKGRVAKEVVESCNKARQASISKDSQGFLNSLVSLTLDHLLTSAESLVQNKDFDKFSKFVRKCLQLSLAFGPDDRGSAEDVKINEGINRFVLSILNLVSSYKDDASDKDIRILIDVCPKLAFYIGRVSLHLSIITAFLETGIECTPPTNVVELKEFKPLWINNDVIELDIPGDSDISTIISDVDRLWIGGGNRSWAYTSRAGEFGQVTLVPNCTVKPISPDLSISNGEVSSLSTKNAVTFKLPKPEIDPSLPVDKSHIPIILFAADYPLIYALHKYLPNEDEKHVTFYVLVTYSMASGSPVFVSAKKVETAHFKPENSLPDKDAKDLTLHYFAGILLLHSPSSKTTVLINPITAEVVSEKVVTDKAIRGVDNFQKKAFYLKADGQKLLVGDIDLYQGYDLLWNVQSSTTSEKVPVVNNIVDISKDDSFDEEACDNAQPITIDMSSAISKAIEATNQSDEIKHIEEYIRTLLKLTFTAKFGRSTLELSSINQSDHPILMSQPNVMDVRRDSFNNLLKLLTYCDQLPQSSHKYFMTLATFKILDTHLNVAYRLQNTNKEELKLLTQEIVSKLRKLVIKASLPSTASREHLSNFDRLKINLLRNLIALSSAIKTVGKPAVAANSDSFQQHC